MLSVLNRLKNKTTLKNINTLKLKLRGIRYTKNRGIRRNSAEYYGIKGNSVFYMEYTELKNHTEFGVSGIPKTPYCSPVHTEYCRPRNCIVTRH